LNELQQILVNLVVNARDAVLAEGTKTVTVTVREEGDEGVLEVRDEGPGLTEELREKIFDPFFTTKPVGRGTGLGLAVSQQIAEAHGGKLLALEHPPPGATFQLRLQKS
jgi:C4-dicarboxylate-specific signal transduction histidine kinase